MIDNNKILHYKSAMLLNSQGGAKLLGVLFSGIFNLPSVISESEFKGALEYCKAIAKDFLRARGILLS